ncbi:MAG: recombinase family protein [Candidatus Parvarchaeota archaeon]
MSIKAAVYIRVSSPSKEGQSEDEKRQTTENQRLKIEDWLKFQKDIESVQWFSDEQTGRNTKRPGFQEMIRGIEEGRFNMVIGLRVDRLFRSMKDLVTYANFFREHKCGMITIDQSINIDPEWKSPSSQLLLHILGAIAEFEDVLISSRTKDGLDRVRNENRKIGRPPFGFIKDPNNHGKFIPIPEQMEIARKVIRLRARGGGYGEIAQRTGLTKTQVKRILSKKEIYK